MMRSALPGAFCAPVLALLLSANALPLRGQSAASTAPTAAQASEVSAAALRAHVAFLASDLLEGRGTPSRGLELAAQYIATQFSIFGLTPLKTGGYFQDSAWLEVRGSEEPPAVRLKVGDRVHEASPEAVAVRYPAALAISDEPVRLWRVDSTAAVLPVEQSKGGAVVAVLDPQASGGAAARLASRAASALRRRPVSQRPATLVIVGSGDIPASFRQSSFLVEDGGELPQPPVVYWHAPGLAQELWQASEAELSLRVPSPKRMPVVLRNVIGVLEGSDPVLRNSYVLLSAHYDHIGLGYEGPDLVFNGANDNASGVAVLLEMARILTKSGIRPRRSIVFAAWFGEESGLLGSRYYVRHPPFPLRETVLNLNFEQMGRADSEDEKRVIRLTGPGFSTLGKQLKEVVASTGIRVAEDAASDAYFTRSDNVVFAEAGVPAHTVSVQFSFPEYHRPDDEDAKLDYENMRQVTSALAALVWEVAETNAPPAWEEHEPRTARYREAWKQLHGVEAAAPGKP